MIALEPFSNKTSVQVYGKRELDVCRRKRLDFGSVLILIAIKKRNRKELKKQNRGGTAKFLACSKTNRACGLTLLKVWIPKQQMSSFVWIKAEEVWIEIRWTKLKQMSVTRIKLKTARKIRNLGLMPWDRKRQAFWQTEREVWHQLNKVKMCAIKNRTFDWHCNYGAQ